MHRVYLAGPITALTVGEATGWRERFAIGLRHMRPDIIVADPLRAKKQRLSEVYGDNPLPAFAVDGDPMVTDRGIFVRDRRDVVTADALLVNLLGAKIVSIGTCFELAWAHQARVPIVVVMEAEGNPHEHAFVREAVDYRVTTLPEAHSVLDRLLVRLSPRQEDENGG